MSRLLRIIMANPELRRRNAKALGQRQEPRKEQGEDKDVGYKEGEDRDKQIEEMAIVGIGTGGHDVTFESDSGERIGYNYKSPSAQRRFLSAFGINAPEDLVGRRVRIVFYENLRYDIAIGWYRVPGHGPIAKVEPAGSVV